MNNPFLWEKMKAVQEEYQNLLQQLQPHVESDDFRFIINEIVIFWYSRRKLVQLFLENVAEEKDAFLFCGASFLDVNEGEHWPFLATGRIHIMDDPLCKFADAIKQSMNSDFYRVMKQQILLAFDDNISILKSFLGKIILLPVSSAIKGLSGKDNSEYALVVFNSMLNEPIEPQELFSITDLETLTPKFKRGVLENIIFCDEDTPTDPIEIKLDRYLTTVGDPFGEIPIVQKLIHAILGCLFQSLDILTMCGQFSLIPYIRSNVVYSYMLSISQGIMDIDAFRQIINGMIYAHSLYLFFDCDLSGTTDTEDCLKRIEEATDLETLWNPVDFSMPFSKEQCSNIIEVAKKAANTISSAFRNQEE